MAFLYKQSYKFKNTTTTSTIYKSFELANYSMNYFHREFFKVVVMYRPTLSATNAFTLSMFLNEFRQFLESLLICGDFNFHSDAPEDRPAQRFSDLLVIFNLAQHVNGETHRNGHTL